MVTSKNLILKYNFLIYCHYWYEKYQCIEKKVSCWNKCSVFRSNIETIWCMFHEKHFHCPVWTYLHRFDLHIIIRWPKNVRRVNKICLHCGHFIHCYILLNFVLFFSTSWVCDYYRHGMCFRASSVFVLSILFWFPQCTHYFWRVFRFLFM
jgi:hypothetical protein